MCCEIFKKKRRGHEEEPQGNRQCSRDRQCSRVCPMKSISTHCELQHLFKLYLSHSSFFISLVSENDFIHSVHIGPPQIMQQEESSHCHFHVCCEKEQHYTLFSHHHFNYPPSGTHTLQEQGSSLSIKNREIIYFSMTSGRARSSSLSPSPSFPLL